MQNLHGLHNARGSLQCDQCYAIYTMLFVQYNASSSNLCLACPPTPLRFCSTHFLNLLRGHALTPNVGGELLLGMTLVFNTLAVCFGAHEHNMTCARHQTAWAFVINLVFNTKVCLIMLETEFFHFTIGKDCGIRNRSKTGTFWCKHCLGITALLVIYITFSVWVSPL